MLPVKFFHGFRAMSRNINAQLTHGDHRLGPNGTWLYACALHLEALRGIVTQQSFRHLTSGGISGAQNKRALFMVHAWASDCEA
jgi:hypothetical protein